MKDYIDYIKERAVEIVYYIIEHKAMVLQTAKRFRVSKNTLHKDATKTVEQYEENERY